jgi:hypothetical protein
LVALPKVAPAAINARRKRKGPYPLAKLLIRRAGPNLRQRLLVDIAEGVPLDLPLLAPEPIPVGMQQGQAGTDVSGRSNGRPALDDKRTPH